jgi:hypothetical protein
LTIEELTEQVVARGGTKAKKPQAAVLNAIEYARQVAWDDGYTTWLDEQSILASFELKADELTVTTQSRELWDQVVDRLHTLLPDATLISSHQLAASDVLSGEVSPLIRPPAEPESPEIQAALRAYLEDYERQWVDDHIPALGGLTPREALQHPASRRDLLALLDDMPEVESGMSPDRIRALLGIT